MAETQKFTQALVPYAYEYGRSNGDGTFSVVIERGEPRNPAPDWPVKPLFADIVEMQAAIIESIQQLDAIIEDGIQTDFRQWRDDLIAALGDASQIPNDGYLTVADPALIDQAWERYRAATDTPVKASEVNTEAFDYLTKTTEG